MARRPAAIGVLAVAVILFALAASACSDDDASPGSTVGAATLPPPPPPSATTTESQSAEAAPADGHINGATAFTACAGAGDFWPTMTLALDGNTVWVACKEEMRLVRLNAKTGASLGEVELDWEPIAVVAGLGFVWALDSEATLYKIDRSSGEIAERIDLEASAPYNLWIGAGKVWSIDDETGEVLRINPAQNRVTARIAVGNGPADMIFRGTTAWVVNHRTGTLVRLNTSTRRVKNLGKLRPSDAPERMAWLAGSLWITGRGTDLLRVNPATGKVTKVVEIGAGGIDVIAAGGALWVPSRNAQVDGSGLPTMAWLKRVVPGKKAKTFKTPTAPVDVHGLAGTSKFVWLADNTEGVVYRIPIG